ncbi:MAG TPA: VTT domain-containing protein [Candidatus Paceibacterota bacterium]|nr:VTT domain-containing protein [Candidatus Paceibacterota bacterium]
MEMLISVLHSVTMAVGFPGVVFIAFLQEVFPPLPSSAIAMSLGFLLFAGMPLSAETLWSLFLHVGLPIAFGLTVGAVIIYSIVAWGGMALIDRWGKWIGITRADIEKLQGRLQGTVIDDVLLLVARSLPVVPSIAINIVAGLIRWKIIPFVVITFVGTIIRAMWAAAIGWQVGRAFEQYASAIEQIHAWIIAALVLATALFLWHRRRKSRNATMG